MALKAVKRRSYDICSFRVPVSCACTRHESNQERQTRFGQKRGPVWAHRQLGLLCANDRELLLGALQLPTVLLRHLQQQQAHLISETLPAVG